MDYLYGYSKDQLSREKSNIIKCAAIRLHEKLINLDLNKINISDYNKRYLENYLIGHADILQRYSLILALALNDSEFPLEEFVLVDYGGGIGLLSLLACEIGVGHVIYNDIYDISCKDAKKLSESLGLRVEDYICGDIDYLLSYIKSKSIEVSAIVSYDVIEHIYNIGDFLKKSTQISNCPFRVVHASSANNKNPLCVKNIKKEQQNYEYRSRNKVWGWKERDSLKSYLEIRKDIILTLAPGLPQEEIENLARLTRGLKKEDIEECVNSYINKGTINYKIDHPTNTCDPLTGNWAEHLMDAEWLSAILAKEGFNVEILPGYWGYTDNILKGLISKMLDALICTFQRKALYIAPYFILYASHNEITEHICSDK
jgi:2-polyprenyl-3-methyl-5-hydroxy-6-metoxy-1,4-benzoquinol methylase